MRVAPAARRAAITRVSMGFPPTVARTLVATPATCATGSGPGRDPARTSAEKPLMFNVFLLEVAIRQKALQACLGALS
jgi:hypothetical protein